MGGVGKSSGQSISTSSQSSQTLLRERGSTTTSFADPDRQFIFDNGWDKLPQVVDNDDDFKFYASQSDYPLLFRGVSADSEEILQAFQDALRTGEWYANSGNGQYYGPGLYLAMADPRTRNKKQAGSHSYTTAISYATRTDSGAVNIVALKKGTRLADIDDMPKHLRANIDKKDNNVNVLQWAKDNNYDGLRVNVGQGVNYVVVYNRSKLIIRNKFDRMNSRGFVDYENNYAVKNGIY